MRRVEEQESRRVADSPAAAAGTLSIGGDLRVNRLGFGGMRLCGPGIWGWPADRENALRVLRRAVELGVNFIDTSDAYGPAVNEEQIAQALYPYPDGLVIATKGGLTRGGPGEWARDGRPERIKACCEESLRRLKRETIDLYQLHAIDTKVPLEEQVGAALTLQREGKIRHAGLSNVTLEQLREAQRIMPIVSVQNHYNIAYRDASEDVLEQCERDGLAFIPYFPIGAGDSADLTQNTELAAVAKSLGCSVFQLAIAWLLARSKVMLPIPGTQSLAHLEENVRAASIALGPEERSRLGL